jgi:hypothetical protein
VTGAQRSPQVSRWKAGTFRPTHAEVQAARDGADSLTALHAALGAEAPPCTEDPDRWTSDAPEDVARAAAECAPCPAREECFSYGVDIRAACGVWGGEHLTSDSYQGAPATRRPAPEEMTA